MATKSKKPEGEQEYEQHHTTIKVTPSIGHKQTINVTRIAPGGHGGDYGVRRSGHSMAMSGGAPAGAYQQLSQLGSDNLQKNRAREKKDMQELNERLANYIEKVRFLEAQNRKLVADLENLRSKWGKETAQIKAMYETELAAARKLLDDSEKGKAELELRVAALMEEIEELSKSNDELKKDLAADKETIERQNQQLSDYESELALLRRRVAQLDKDDKKNKAQIKQLQDEVARARQDLDNETLCRVCADNDKQSLQEELDFCKKVHEQEMKELAALAYRDTTPENREFWKNEMAQCLHELQCEYETKMDGMKGELESYYNAKLQEFRTGATRNNMESTHNKDEVKRLRGQMNDLRSKITDLEAKNAHLEKLLQELQREYDEKTREWELERSELESENGSLRAELESVLQELQNLLDAKLSLELEIAAYRKLLEGEETRIGLRNVVEQVVTTQEVEQTKHGKKVGLRSVVESLDYTTTEYDTSSRYGRGGRGGGRGGKDGDDIDGGQRRDGSRDGDRGGRGGPGSDRDGRGGPGSDKDGRGGPGSDKDGRGSPGSGGRDKPRDSDKPNDSATPEKTPKKKAPGAIKGEMSSRTTYQRSAKGNISIAECTSDGRCVTVENTGTTDTPLNGWKIVRKLDGNRPNIVFTFGNSTLPHGKKIKIWAKGAKPPGSPDLEMPQDKSWGMGQNITTCLYNTDGDERATHVQKTTYSS